MLLAAVNPVAVAVVEQEVLLAVRLQAQLGPLAEVMVAVVAVVAAVMAPEPMDHQD
jgi:hypothetical protein